MYYFVCPFKRIIHTKLKIPYEFVYGACKRYMVTALVLLNYNIKNRYPLLISGLHRGSREGHGDLVCHPAQQGHDVWRVHGGGVRENQPERTPLRHPLQLQPLLLPQVHQKMEKRQAVREQDHKV